CEILGHLALIAMEFGCVEGESAVSWLPFHHDMGLVVHVLQPLYSGIHNYFLVPVEFVARPLRWLSAISRYRATISGGPTFAYHLCCKRIDRKSTRLNSSHVKISYAVFCLKKKNVLDRSSE